MQIVACQSDIVWEDKDANYRNLYEMLQGVGVAREALVVLPEMFSTGFSMKVPRIAEGEARPSEQFLARLATDFGVYAQGGLVNRAEDGKGLNQSVTFGPDGAEIARYTKMHPFSFAKEDRYYAAGSGPVTFDWAGVTVAPTVCYDLRFPELYRVAVQRGAVLVTVIANWPERRESHWVTLLRARAIENQAYVVGVNRCGNDPWLSYSGHSLIVDPRGEIIADAGSNAGLITANVDLDELRGYREEFPALADIRGDLTATC